MVAAAKSELRKRIGDLRDALSSGELERRSRSIGELLSAEPAFTQARTVAFYVQRGSEVHTASLITAALARGVEVAAPVVEGSEIHLRAVECLDGLVSGSFGIAEPCRVTARKISPESVEVVVVPGLVFDREGHRLGYGMGFYDRFLGGISPEVMTFGLAFDFQVVERIPRLQHDVPVGAVVTDGGIIRCR